MARGLDHVVHAVSDLDAAASLYARAGFTVGARNRHAPAWGTQNHIVQLPGFFVELLAMADTSAIAPHGERYFSFGAFNRDFLARQEGLSMLVLEGSDSAAEAEAFRSAGIGDFDRFNFERDAKRPDGTPTKVAFSLAFARDAKRPTSATLRASSIIRKISGILRSSSTRTARSASPASCRSPTIPAITACFCLPSPVSATWSQTQQALRQRLRAAKSG